MKKSLSITAKTLELLKKAIDFEEDVTLLLVALRRENGVKKMDYLNHEGVWSCSMPSSSSAHR